MQKIGKKINVTLSLDMILQLDELALTMRKHITTRSDVIRYLISRGLSQYYDDLYQGGAEKGIRDLIL